MTTPAWRGVFTALCTQFTADDALDTPATLAHLDAQLAAGVQGVIVAGSVGENTALDLDEKEELLDAVVGRVGQKVPVLVGVAETTTRRACEWAASAAARGADGAMVLPPMVYPSDFRETSAHLREIARSSPLPIMLYNNPPAYKVDITPEQFAELADEPKFVCIKESSDDPRRVTDILNRCGDRYAVLAGVDDLFLECFVLGAVGWISGLVNAFPAENRLIWDLASAGRWEEARAVYRWYTPLLHLDTHPKLVQYIKLASAENGYGSERCRAPRLALEGAERERVLKIIRDAQANRPKVKL